MRLIKLSTGNWPLRVSTLGKLAKEKTGVQAIKL